MAAQGITPQALLERPTLQPGLDVYLAAYYELQHDRPIGMSAGTIPWSSIQRWADLHGMLDMDEVADLENHIRMLEAAERKYDEENAIKK